jgi:hypothetical protein
MILRRMVVMLAEEAEHMDCLLMRRTCWYSIDLLNMNEFEMDTVGHD